MSLKGDGATLFQVGALPFREVGDSLWVLLITSRQTGRWVVPKGNLMIGKAPHEAAAIEAEEEAGVTGIVAPLPLGRFRYVKLYADGRSANAEVDLFAMEVNAERKNWIEMDQRQRRWFVAADAAAAVDEADLGDLIQRFGAGEGPRPVTGGV